MDGSSLTDVSDHFTEYNLESDRKQDLNITGLENGNNQNFDDNVSYWTPRDRRTSAQSQAPHYKSKDL